jgi:ADP-heptose:LPS heptosyltransferase
VKSKPVPAGELSRILVLCRPLLGDMILTGPVFRNLRSWQPEARITAVCLEGKRDLLSLAPEISAIVEIPRRRTGSRRSFFARWAGVIRKLRAERYDLVFDLMQTDRSSMLCSLIGARWRVGFVKGPARLRHRVYTHTAPWREGDGEPDHALDLHLAPLRAAGMPVVTRSIAVEPGRAAVGEIRDPARPLVACHPGASSANKCWPLEEFAAACDLLQTELGARVLLLGGAREAPALCTLRSLMRSEPERVLETHSVAELAATLAQADLFFGHDSGPMHVAAAVGTPVVALFGASPPPQWRPLGVDNVVVRPPMPCRPCPFPALCHPPSPYNMLCVRRITPAEVDAALLEAVARL